MDLDQKTPSAENLRQLPYSELRKVAAKFGIQRMMKAEKLIVAIMSRYSDNDESFSTPVAKELNSSRKNKEKKFDEIHMTPLATPRRGTYSLETPLSVKIDLSSASLAVNTSILDISNVTMSRGSERKLRPRKVSFMSPVMTPRTPKSQSLRNRPKTPIASRTPLNESVSSVSLSGRRKRKSLEEAFITPETKIVKFETDSDVKSSIVPETTPLPSSMQKAKKDEKPLKNIKSSATKSVVTKEPTSLKKGTTPSATKSVVTKEPTSLKKGTTPNFRRVHQKAFDKMESIDDYQKRKLLNSTKKADKHPTLKSIRKAKSQIPAFSGIPFIPSVSSSISLKMNSKVKKFMASVDNSAKENSQTAKSKLDLKAKNLSRRDTPQSVKSKAKNLSRGNTPQPAKAKFDFKTKSKRENTPQTVKSKSKFDLKISLSRKLGYKPYRGPLKPLSESNSLHISNATKKEPVINKVVKENRLQTRSIIKGVRTNKRFALQMKNRKMD